MTKNIARIAISCVLAASVVAAYAKGPALGKPVPSFKMTDLSGKAHTNQSLRGKVVLLDFWATWCGPCKMASPVMQKLHTKYGSKGLVVIGANAFERGNSKQLAGNYRKEHGYTYTFTVDNSKLADAWGIRGIPQFYLIDKKGVVRWQLDGFDPDMESALSKQIEKLL